MAFSVFPIFMMLFAGGGIGNDLLDFVPTKAYFESVGIEMNVAALSEVLEAPVAGDAAAKPGDSARRQLALRALGELKDEAALPVIEKQVKSRDPLVADYAKAARAAIKGEKHQRAVPREELLRQDLACLPSGLGVIGRLTPSSASGGGGNLIEQMKTLMGDIEGAPDPKELEAQIVGQLGSVMSMLGNVRVSAITVGVSSEIGDDEGFVVAIAPVSYTHLTLPTNA